MASRAAPSRRASISRHRGDCAAAPARSRADVFAEQSAEAIAAGAFHNDVVAVANERVLFAHEHSLRGQGCTRRRAGTAGSGLRICRGPDADVPLADAIRSYLFNAQLVTPPDGETTLIVPAEPGRRRRFGAGWSGTSRATARSAGSKSSMSGNRWPMAAARPACACASLPTRPRWTRASWSTKPGSTGSPGSSPSSGRSKYHTDDLQAPALVADYLSERGAALLDEPPADGVNVKLIDALPFFVD